jgi:predicted acetyltransferase
MENLTLVKPGPEHEAEVLAYRDEMIAAASVLNGMGTLRDMVSYAQWLEDCRRMENADTLPPGLVTAEQYLYVREADGRVVGMIQLRHTLNAELASHGGHIGYSVRPSERRKGYAKRMLAACLAKGRERGLARALVTCLTENEASRRTILATAAS